MAKNEAMTGVTGVRPGKHPLTLVIDWEGGGADNVDLTGLVAGDPAFAALSDPDFFAQVHTVGYGSGIAWTDDLDIAGHGLKVIADEQRPMTRKVFVAWCKERKLSAAAAGRLLGRSATQVKAYRSGAAEIPLPVAASLRAMMRDEMVFLAHYRPTAPVGRPRKQAD